MTRQVKTKHDVIRQDKPSKNNTRQTNEQTV